MVVVPGGNSGGCGGSVPVAAVYNWALGLVPILVLVVLVLLVLVQVGGGGAL